MPATSPVLNVSASFSSVTETASTFAAGSSRRAFQPVGSAAASSNSAAPIISRISRLLWLVGRARLALQPLVHPADDVLQPLDAVPRLARAGELVGLAREAHHHRRDPAVLQRA